jgi:hypothetical protein
LEVERLLAITGLGVAGLTETAVHRLPCNLMTQRTQGERVDYIALATLNCPPVNALYRDRTSAGAAKLH